MVYLTTEVYQAHGAGVTAKEIFQQPEVWRQALFNYQEKEETIRAFLQPFEQVPLRIILTGAGTSAYVGDTLLPYLEEVYATSPWRFQSVATTELLVSPARYLQGDMPILLVSFARSGNSPESVACVQLAKQWVSSLYQITITCASEGHLAKQAHGDSRNLLLLQPEASNDAGFAMTSSFTSMLLTALLIFSKDSLEEKMEAVSQMIRLSEQVLDQADSIYENWSEETERVIYLGAGSFFGLAHEAQLKILELTAGKLATMYESPVGFRHGPKSLIDGRTQVLLFGSVDAYRRLYDQDLLLELAADQIAQGISYLGAGEMESERIKNIVLDNAYPLEDIYRAFPYVVYAQLLALVASMKVGNRADTPSPTGTVNRVVQGVVIHPYTGD